VSNGVIKVNANKTWNLVADLSAYQKSHPVKNPEPDDFEPDGTWYSMLSLDGNLYALEPNHGELVKVSHNGDVSRVADISASQGHIVPTAMVFHDGNFYIGNLSTFPIAANSNIYKITPSGNVSVVASGFSTILGIAFDQVGGLYVLENTTGNPFPTPGTGDVIRIDPSGQRKVLINGLNLPTAMTFGPDNKLYISNWGFGPPAIGGGEILKVDISCPKNQSPKG
jgi:sugar lactone lactonase YvrE